MNQDKLFKYKIGFIVIGVFILIMTIVVLAESGAVKHDKKLYEKADDIATKLNNYTDDHSKVPTSLRAAGVDDAPEDISYRKLSDQKYQFCLNYKSDSSSAGTAQNLVNWYYGDSGYYGTGEEESYLYLNPDHKKGNNCQTVKIYSYDDSYDYDSDSYNTQID